MKDNFETFLISQMEEVMSTFTSNLEEIIESGNELGKTQKEDILKDFYDQSELPQEKE